MKIFFNKIIKAIQFHIPKLTKRTVIVIGLVLVGSVVLLWGKVKSGQPHQVPAKETQNITNKLLVERGALTLADHTDGQFALPIRLEIRTPQKLIRLDFTGPGRTLNILIPSDDGAAPASMPFTNYTLQLLRHGDDEQAILVDYVLLSWGEHSCSMNQLPESIRNKVRSLIELGNVHMCGDFVHGEVPPNPLQMLADEHPVVNVKEFWDRCQKKDPRFTTITFPRQAQRLPAGWVTQSLEPVGGSFPQPADWHFVSRKEPNAYKWYITKEDFAKGPYDTGVSIQMFLGITATTGKTPQQFALDWLDEKRKAYVVHHEQGEIARADTRTSCLEVEEGKYRIHYNVMWTTNWDILWVMTSGAPKELWPQYSQTLKAIEVGKLLDADRIRQILAVTNVPSRK